MEAINAHHLEKSFSTGRRRNRAVVEAVRDISITVQGGERVAYIGPNGAGKSTSIKIFTGILQPTAGEVQVLGLVPWRDRIALTRRIGVLFGQRSQLWSELTPHQGLTMLGAIFRLERSSVPTRLAEVAELLDATDLLDQPVRSLSLGQRMRCELAASLLHRPEILFLDEPTIGLDLVAKQVFRSLISRLNEENNTTIFLTSHDVADIEAVAERVIIINHGEVVYDGSVTALRQSALSQKLVEVHFADPTEVSVSPGVEIVDSSPFSCELRVDTRVTGVSDLVAALLQRYAVVDLSVADPPLEDVIGDLYAGRPT